MVRYQPVIRPDMWIKFYYIEHFALAFAAENWYSCYHNAN